MEVKTELGLRALEIAKTQISVREATGHNDGDQVEKYLKSIGLSKGYSWCMAFVYWCFDQAAAKLQVANPLHRTGGVLAQWNARPTLRVHDPEPGDIFIMDYGRGLGHTGIVTAVHGDVVDTIEGNTNGGGSREGDGVYPRTRKIKSIRGFLRC